VKVTDLKINGMRNPVGFDFSRIKCSWKVADAQGKYQKNAVISVATDPEMTRLVFRKSGERLSSIGELVEVELTPRTKYYVTVEITDELGNIACSEPAFFETGKLDEPWQAQFITTREADTFHPVFFKDFHLAGCVRSASIHVSGLGLYEAYLNGQKIGNEYLAPFCNDYQEAIQVQTYDVNALLTGENRLEIMTGNGWYKGRLGYEGHQAYYGNRFKAIAELHIRLEDGTETVICTDDSWSYRPSDIIHSDLYDGEVIDRRKREKKVKGAVLDDSDDCSRLTARYSLPLVVKDTLKVKEVLHTPAGETVLDMGQNFAGFMEFRAKLPKGTCITLDHGEILQNGNFYNDNFRTAKAQLTYYAGGQEETVRAHFTYFGFRYVRVTGWPGKLNPEDFRGQVLYSDMDTTAEFDSSDEKLNRLFQNVMWGQRSNFLDMPTDCPQRDERLAWTGDAQVFSPTACYNMDAQAFFGKFLRDLRLDQLKHEGAIANYLPNIGGLPGGSSVWGDVATFLPMTLYQAYGDADLLGQHYPMMRDWVNWIIRADEAHGNRGLWDFGFHFGDWLALDGITEHSMKGGTEDAFVASVYYYASLQKTAEAAKILGIAADEAKYSNKARQVYQAILQEYFTPSGRFSVDSQTAYMLCLRYGVYRNRERILSGLSARLKKDCYRIRGGFAGAPILCQTLADHGMEDVAAYFLFQKNFPGWMHCIDLGATTIWERWNSVLDDGSISGTGMNSLNHYAYGAVMEYVYRNLAGIQPARPGFRSVVFRPQLTSKLRHLSFAYDSASGKYSSHWQINEDGSVTIRFQVPFNAEAKAILPATDGKVMELKPGITELTYQPNRDYRKKYSLNTRLGELVEDDEAMSILKEDFPLAYSFAVSGDAENENLALGELGMMFFLGFNPKMAEEGTRRILEMK